MISVVVPVYKVEKYLDKCVQSILAQTYKDFELILVDDGSPDSCPGMCDEYAKKDKRIRVIHKENGGLSDARNHGIDVAKGNYITFIDSDDYVSMDYLEVLVGLHNKYNADICVGGISTFYEDEAPTCYGDIKEKVFTGIEALKNMLYQDMLDTSACAMLLPTEVAREHPFPVGKYHEDELTTYKYYSSVNNVAVTTKTLYFYLQRRGSIMHVFGQASIDELEAADNLVQVCKNNWPDLVKAAKSKKFSDYCQVLLSCPTIKKEYEDIHKKIMEYLLANRASIILDKRTRKKNKIAALLLLGGEKTLRYGAKFKK